jgi:hypothetical protein
VNKALVVSIHKRGYDCSPFNNVSWYRENISWLDIAVSPAPTISELDENLNIKPGTTEMMGPPRVITRKT